MTDLFNANAPIAMLLWCPLCGARHVDVGEFATKLHHTHACQKCGLAWRPALVPTVGVAFLPGFKDENPVYPMSIDTGDPEFWERPGK